MKYSIILCEGETDQALIGCYMEKVYNWKFSPTISNNPFPKEMITWYSVNSDRIKGIWQVGGNSFRNAINKIFEREKLDSGIEKIAIITDHDDEEAESNRLDTVKKDICNASGIQPSDIKLTINNWENNKFQSVFVETEIQFLYLLVPLNELGAMETFMMNAISEQSDEKDNVISQAKLFVNGFKSSNYLTKRREKIKAELGISLSIFSPDRVFTTMKELIDSVNWDNFSTSHIQFKLLENC